MFDDFIQTIEKSHNYSIESMLNNDISKYNYAKILLLIYLFTKQSNRQNKPFENMKKL